MAPESPPTLDPLPLTECPASGYALESRPAEGICPEYGVAYRRGAIVTHGFGSGLASGDTRTVAFTVGSNVPLAAFLVVTWDRRRLV